MSRLPFLALLVAVAACAPDGPHIVPIATDTERVWLGPEFYANRLLDWQVNDGWIEAIEGRPQKPMRTVHLLSHALDGAPFSVSVELASAGRSGDESEWGGLLIGAGSPDIDHRITVLTHHWPADGGGVVVALDGAGRLVVRDNSTRAERTGPRGDYVATDWPVLGVADRLSAPASGPVRLTVSFDGDRFHLAAESEGQLLANGFVEDVPNHALSGTVALVSHGSPGADDAGHRFRNWTLDGAVATPDRVWGPVLGLMYTQSRGTLKLTAQFGPLGAQDDQYATLERRQGQGWEEVARAEIDPHSATATFRAEGWDGSTASDIRVRYALRTGDGVNTDHFYEGHVPAEPVGRPFKLAGLNCHHISGGDGSWTHDHFWYPHAELTALVASKDPDMFFFAGDQIYEGGLEGIVRTPTDTAILDYLNHWFRFVRAFGDLTRNRPTVAIPDDHDVYHGNIWGAGGKAATGPWSPASDNGGYIMAPEFVNAVHRTQTSHLPDPVDPEPIQRDITVYHTQMNYAGISFAILADRMWKSAPRALLPDADIWNGWSRNLGYDGRDSDVPGAVLLGERQEAFLEDWADDWSENAWMKVVLSQTPFVNVATIPEDALNGSVIPGLPNPAPGEYLEGYKKAADHDSGGWPQTARDRAVRLMRRGFAVHVAGDQHLGSVVQYGVDEFGDASYAFTVPSIANIWPRRWFPPEGGANREEGAPRYTGDHLDGFGNRMTVSAVANPVDAGVQPKPLYDRTPGFGLVTIDPADRSVVFDAWPRWTDPADPTAPQFEGWPVRFSQEDGYGRARAGYLPAVSLEGVSNPVVRVENETTGEWLYTLRAPAADFRPWVFDATHTYRVRVSDPDRGAEEWMEHQTVETDQ